IEQGGAIRADGGKVLLTARAAGKLATSVINHTGITQAQTLTTGEKGEIVLLGDMQQGQVQVAGTLDASAPAIDAKGGDGGFIETSAAKVKIDKDLQVTTLAQGGDTGEWLIDPTDFTISAGGATKTDSGIGADTLSSNLASTHVTLQTVEAGGEAGDIHVNAAVSWDADTNLTLDAHNDIHINEAITATQGGLVLDAGGTISADGDVNVSTFNLLSGDWAQLGGTLPSFSADDFQLDTANASFLRATAGDGTEANPYELIDVYGLQGMASHSLLSNHFALANDIDASGTANWNDDAGFVPIGTESNTFTGDFDGRNHAIDGLTINRTNTNYVGLFGRTSGSHIRDVDLLNASVSGRIYVGGLAGGASSNSSISDSSVQGDIYGRQTVGGLVGEIIGVIERSHSSGTVEMTDYGVGGLAGRLYNGSINDSYSTASVTGNSIVGGLVGELTGQISRSYATGDVVAAQYGAGLVGSVYAGSIRNSYATGSVQGEYYNGGLVGALLTNGGIIDSYSTGRVQGDHYTGGLLGSHRGGTVNQSYWNTETSGRNNAAGDGSNAGMTGLTTAQMFDAANFLGFDGIWANADGQTTPYLRGLAGNRVFNKNDLPSGTIDTSNRPALYTVVLDIDQLQAMRNDLSANYLLGNDIDASETSGWNSGAGFAPVGNSGNSYSGTFDGLGHIISDLFINRSSINSLYVGLFGYTSNAILRNVGLLNANITGHSSNQLYVGGLVGGGNGGTIEQSFVTGAIRGTKSNALILDTTVGGLAGYYNGSILYSYTSGTVSSIASNLGNDVYAGGLVGYLEGNVSHSYSEASISGSAGYLGDANFGGLTGHLSGGAFEQSYWNTDTSGMSRSAGNGYATGTAGLGTADMLQAANFVDWDIDAQGGTGSVWRIYEGYTAPLLRSFLTALNVNGEDTSSTYDGTEQRGSWSATGDYDADHIFGDVSGGRNAGTYDVDMSGLYSRQQGYDLITTDGTLVINKAQATVTANSGSTTYNGANQQVSGFTVDGLVGGEDQSVLSNVTTSGGSGKNAGTYAHTVDGTDGNYELTFVDGALTIDKAQATVTANSGRTTYNGANQQVSGFTAEGLVGGEDESVLTGVNTSGGSGKNAGTYAHTVDGTDGNYELTFVDGALTIDKAQATVTANSGATTYNGANQQVNGFTVDGLVGGEDQSVLTDVSTSGGSGKNAGTYVHTVDGTDGNYELTFVDGALTIDKAQATVTANSGSTIYNGANQQVNGFSVDGLVGGEDQSVLTDVSTSGGSGKNAGTYVHRAAGTDGNYELTFVDGALTIDKAQATVTANSGTTTYNGANQQVNGFTVDGLVGGEDQSVLTDVSASGGSGKNAGSYAHTVNGTDGNYELTFVDGALTIDKAQATVTANSGSTIYNGANQQVNGFTVDGLVGGEDQSVLTDVSTSGGSGKNAGTYVHRAAGTDGNYELTFVDGALTIDKAQATVTANSGTTTYNGANQQVNGFSVDGLVGGEDQSVLSDVTTSGGSGKNAGTYVHRAEGTDGNYELTFVDGALTIDKAQATVTANSRSTTYNGANQNISGFSVDGLVGGEDQSVLTDVSTSGGSGKNAGTYVHRAEGTDGNYELTFVDGALTIDKAQATVTANSRSTTYNGANQNISGFSVDGLVGGEDQSVLTDVSTSGGSGKNAGNYVHRAAGTDGNYELTFVDGALTIGKAQATVTANSGTTTYNGANQQVNGFTVDGLVGGEDQSVLTDVSTSGGSGKNAGTYAHTVDGTDGNYELTFVDGALTIDKAQATVTANSGSTIYNGANQQVNGFTVDGLVGGEDQSVLSDVTTSGGSGKNAGTYVHRAAGTDGNYELTFVDGALTIDKAQATVTANSGATTYNGANQQVNGFTVDGLVGGEDQSVLSDVTTSGGSGKNAGTYVHRAEGTDGNYELTFVDGALTIDKAQATVTANSVNTTYNGANQQVNGFTVDGLVGGEDQSVLTDVSTSGGSGKNAGTYAHTVDGTDGNYELTFVDGALTIDKAQATVTANSGTTTYNGANQQVNGFTVDGLVGGEDQNVLSDVTTSGGSGKNAGTYVHRAEGTDGNYELTFVDGALTIDKAQATVTANSGTTTYNGANQQVNGFTVDGLVGGEDQSVLTDVSTTGGSGKNAGTYAHTVDGTDGNYELTFVDGSLTIDKAPLIIRANDLTWVLDGSAWKGGNGVIYRGFVNGEDASALTGLLQWGGSSQGARDAGIFSLVPYGLDAANYTLTFNEGVLEIITPMDTVGVPYRRSIQQAQQLAGNKPVAIGRSPQQTLHTELQVVDRGIRLP
ncbi:MBG domain-containing protein, partial [Marinobacterium lutimaris]